MKTTTKEPPVTESRIISYKVVISRLDEVETPNREWKRLADSGNARDDGAVYGYATYVSTESRQEPVFEQVVNDLDFIAVICAVNGIKEAPRD